jgi:hypothetical protein
MHQNFRKIILSLIAIGLLLSFQISTSDFHHEQLAIFDVTQDEESSENENCELEKFFTHPSEIISAFRIYSYLSQNNDLALPKNLSDIPTSPPNA